MVDFVNNQNPVPVNVINGGTAVGSSNPLPVSITSAVEAAFITELDYVSGTNPIYIGVAPSGSATSAAAWAIKKITYDGNSNPTLIAWASTGASNLIWDSRASYTYS